MTQFSQLLSLHCDVMICLLVNFNTYILLCIICAGNYKLLNRNGLIYIKLALVESFQLFLRQV